MANIRQNLVWAFGYNIVLIPVATGLLKPWLGFGLSPMVAGAYERLQLLCCQQRPAAAHMGNWTKD